VGLGMHLVWIEVSLFYFIFH